jgi:hypothetical protein
MVIWVACVVPAAAAPLFPDVPDTWAAEAVRTLASKGLLEGYPDGTFKGDRGATRYEVAMIVARLLAKMEQEHATFATRADADELRRLLHEYQNELTSYGVRIQHLEDDVGKLRTRVAELERITFYGSFSANLVSQTLGGPAPLIGTVADPGIDFSNGRLLYNGVAETARTLLGAQIRVTPDITSGIELVSYFGAGDPLVAEYWGVTPPYNSNPFLSTSLLGGSNAAQGDDPHPFNRMGLDRFWMQDREHDTQFIIGSYHLKNIGDQVAVGVRNPDINAPTLLPFWGTDLTPLKGDDKLQYEFAYSFLPASVYRTWMTTAGAGYDFGRAHLSGSWMRVHQDAENGGQLQGAGQEQLPSANGIPLFWQDKRTGTLSTTVGPQQEDVVGANADVTLLDRQRLVLLGNFGYSSYNPDITKALFNVNVSGYEYEAGLRGRAGQFLADLEYIHVDPTYDTIMLAYPVNPGLPVFLPYGEWYSSNYQLHDYFKYPINREGPRLTVTWANDTSHAYFTFSDFRQVAATTLAQLTSPGNAEPLFPLMSIAGDTTRGDTELAGLGGEHRFHNGLRVGASYYHYVLRRNAPILDDLDVVQNFYRANALYPITPKLYINAHFTYLTFRGHEGLSNRDFDEAIPGLSLDWTPAKNVTMSLGTRWLTFNDKLGVTGDYHANQILMDVNVDF